jgi:hypothetical protein
VTIGQSTANNIGAQAFTLMLWNPILQIGATGLAPTRPIGTELALCQRYYQTGHMLSYGACPATNYIIATMLFPVVMRILPNVIANFTAAVNVGSHGLHAIDAATLELSAFGAATPTDPYGMNVTYIADARL